jgi:hypothetical protein
MPLHVDGNGMLVGAIARERVKAVAGVAKILKRFGD